jgi:hypothetical protein
MAITRRDVFVGATDGLSIPLPPAVAGSNFHHDASASGESSNDSIRIVQKKMIFSDNHVKNIFG